MIEEATLRQCVHCGLCLDACPTYLVTGREVDSPRGRIHLVAALADQSLPMSAELVRHLDLCLGCRGCETACPSGVRYGEILENARADIERRWRRPAAERLRRRLVLTVFPRRRRLRALVALVRGLQALGLWAVVARLVPAARLMPRIEGAAELRPLEVAGEEKARVAMLEGCVTSVLQGRGNLAAQRLLSRCGVAVEVPAGQGCCGALHLHAGDLDEARRLARVNIDAFSSSRPDAAIVVTAAGCGAAMREYGRLLAGDPRYALAAAQLAGRVRDVTEVLADRLPDLGATLLGDESGRRAGWRVTYHDACHLAHAQGIRQAPRRLLEALPNAQLVELAEADLCCGSAGSYNLTEPEMAQTLARRKVDNIERADVDCVAVANPGCAMQIAAELRRRGSVVRVAHPVELLEEALRGDGKT